MQPQIEVVLINYKRPRNIARIVRALRAQTIPCTITICDCHPSFRFALGWRTLRMADRVYRSKQNFGAYNRYVPMGSFSHPYTFFLDDDLLPGKRCLEYFLQCAQQQPNFGVLGQFGRRLEADGSYNPRSFPRKGGFDEADFLVRAYFVATPNLTHIMPFRWYLNYFDVQMPEDDLLLSASIKYYTGLPPMVVPLDADKETRVNIKELEAPFALNGRSDHLERRNAFIQRLIKNGWYPMAAQTMRQPSTEIAEVGLTGAEKQSG